MTNDEVLVLEKMQVVRDICALGHKQRDEAGISIKTPLASIKVKSPYRVGLEGKELPIELEEDYKDLIRDELNVKEVVFV